MNWIGSSVKECRGACGGGRVRCHANRADGFCPFRVVVYDESCRRPNGQHQAKDRYVLEQRAQSLPHERIPSIYTRVRPYANGRQLASSAGPASCYSPCLRRSDTMPKLRGCQTCPSILRTNPYSHSNCPMMSMYFAVLRAIGQSRQLGALTISSLRVSLN